MPTISSVVGGRISGLFSTASAGSGCGALHGKSGSLQVGEGPGGAERRARWRQKRDATTTLPLPPLDSPAGQAQARAPPPRTCSRPAPRPCPGTGGSPPRSGRRSLPGRRVDARRRAGRSSGGRRVRRAGPGRVQRRAPRAARMREESRAESRKPGNCSGPRCPGRRACGHDADGTEHRAPAEREVVGHGLRGAGAGAATGSVGAGTRPPAQTKRLASGGARRLALPLRAPEGERSRPA